MSRRWWAFAAICLAAFITALDNTIVNVALPTIQRDLRVSVAGLEWIVSAYLLTFTGFMLVGGRLADLFGRRRLLLLGFTIFMTSSLLAGLAPDDVVLVFARGLQGIGGAFVTPVSLAILSSLFTSRGERTIAVAVWTTLTATAVALGPLVGGLIVQGAGWHAIFLVNVPVCTAGIVLTRLTLVETRVSTTPRYLDLPGLVTLVAALLGFTYVLIEAHNAGVASARILGVAALAVAAAVGFVVVESLSRAPMVDVDLFRNRVYTGGTLAVMLWGGGVMGVFFYTSLFLQDVLVFAPSQAGLIFLPLALTMVVSALPASLLATRIGINATVALALGVMAAGMVVASFLRIHSGLSQLLPPLLVIGLGSGLITPLTSSILGSLPSAREALGSAILNTAREMSALLGVTVLGAVLAFRQSAALHVGEAPDQAFADGYSTELLFAAALLAIGAAVSYLMLERRPDRPGTSEDAGREDPTTSESRSA